MGHSCFLIEMGGKVFLTDPFISGNPLAKHIDIASLQADYILVSHGHGDHVADLVALANQTKAEVICNFEIYLWLEKQGYLNVRPINIGGSCQLENTKVKAVVAIHSSVLPDGSNGGNPLGFVLSNGQKTIYFAGDTALTYDMKLIADEYAVDMVILPIGDTFTMGVEDAAKAAEFCNTAQVVGMHYDTFEPIKIDKNRAIETFDKKGVKLTLMQIGQTLDY